MEASIAEEEYIDMDVSSAATVVLTRPSSPPPPQSRDFEFQMSGQPLPEMDGITSPADELFYEGKLLPLRVRKLLLLQGSSTPTHSTESLAGADANATPYVSCNASPAASCCVSGELDPESCFGGGGGGGGECRLQTEEPAQPRTGKNKSWSRRLKQSSLGLGLKASRAYLKSLFTGPGCSDESCAVPKAKEWPKAEERNAPPGGVRRASSSLRRADAAEKTVAEGGRGHGHRRSFSSVNSNNSNGLYGPQSSSSSSSSGSSGSSEAECSIQGAIAYCKKSQQEARARKAAADVEFYALSASRIAADCEKQERPQICRG